MIAGSWQRILANVRKGVLLQMEAATAGMLADVLVIDRRRPQCCGKRNWTSERICCHPAEWTGAASELNANYLTSLDPASADCVETYEPRHRL